MSILACGVALGSAINSLTTIAISYYGWRAIFSIIGILWMAFGVIFLLAVKEPTRSKYSVITQEST